MLPVFSKRAIETIRTRLQTKQIRENLRDTSGYPSNYRSQESVLSSFKKRQKTSSSSRGSNSVKKINVTENVAAVKKDSAGRDASARFSGIRHG